MKDTMKNINTNTHYVFNRKIPKLVNEFKEFVAQVNKYLAGLRIDKRYHKSNTCGMSKHSNITVEDDNNIWSFSGKISREDHPYTDEAVFYFRGVKIWSMKRKSQFTFESHGHEEDVLTCIRHASMRCNQDRPWCGPNNFHDASTELDYSASFAGTDDHFVIEETVRNKSGILLWMGTCEGGYSV